MSTKYYRVKKDTFLWGKGAILTHNPTLGSEGGYTAIEDVWDATPEIKGEYISSRIIEHPDNSQYFERVYTNDIKGKIFYTKDKLVEMYNKTFTN